MHCRMWLGARFLCLLSVCSSLTWVGGQGPRGGQAAGDWMGRDTRRQGDRTSWLCLPRQWRLGATQPLCLLSAGGEAGGHAIVSMWCGDNRGGGFSRCPLGSPGPARPSPPHPQRGLGRRGARLGGCCGEGHAGRCPAWRPLPLPLQQLSCCPCPCAEPAGGAGPGLSGARCP